MFFILPAFKHVILQIFFRPPEQPEYINSDLVKLVAAPSSYGNGKVNSNLPIDHRLDLFCLSSKTDMFLRTCMGQTKTI